MLSSSPKKDRKSPSIVQIEPFLAKLRKLNIAACSYDECLEYETKLRKIQDAKTELRFKGRLQERKESLRAFESYKGATKIKLIKGLKKLCEMEVLRLKNIVSSQSAITFLAEYRRAIKEEFGLDSPSLVFMTAGKNALQKRNDNYKMSVKKRNVTDFPAQMINKFIETSISLLNRESYAQQVAGVVALTGRRPIEILLTGKFSDSKEGWLKFSGQAKTKGRGDIGEYEIPAFPGVTAGRLNEVLDSIRSKKNFDEMTSVPKGKILSQVVHDNVSGHLSTTTKRAFYSLLGDISIYDLRALWCAIQAHLQQPNNVDKFYSDMLGHAEKDGATQLSYRDFRVI